MTYNLLDSVTLTSSASSVTFSSIDQSYRDLVLVSKAYSTTSTGYGGSSLITLNSDTGTNYAYLFMSGSGSTTSSGAGTVAQMFQNYLSNADYKSFSTFHFLDYSATDKHKPILARIDAIGAFVRASTYRWTNTSAITQIDISASGGTMASGSTFYLYGVAG